jgi:shikimate dehydrogenase
MKKYLVVGNPIEHSLSPLLHNFWIKENNIEAVYEKKELNVGELKKYILDIKQKKINGMNVTVPFKKSVIPYLDQLTEESQSTQSVNTIYLKNNKTVGHNTDIDGFKISIEKLKIDIQNKEIFIIGAGGVVPSIIFALNKMNVSKIFLTNRTKQKAQNLKNQFSYINIIDWGVVPKSDVIINATSVGLNKNEKLDLDFSKCGNNNLFFDVIYNPKQTNFLKLGKELGNNIENGKMMFIYQAALAFKIWHGNDPLIDDKIIKMLD